MGLNVFLENEVHYDLLSWATIIQFFESGQLQAFAHAPFHGKSLPTTASHLIVLLMAPDEAGI